MGNTLGIVLTAYKIANKPPDPKVTLVATIVSWESYIAQFNIQINSLQ